MSILTRAFLTLAALGTFMLPIGSKAQAMSTQEPIFGTPVSVKGRFVFMHRISRRQLKNFVADTQQPWRPVALKELL